jgi:nicotinate-nucleotide adenylyltransferase
MTRLAIAGNPFFAVDTSDVDRPPPHFTYTLLPLIQAQYPQAALWFLLGTDSLADLPQWQCPEQLLQDGPLVKISATMVRGLAAANRSLRYLIPETVQEYITRHTLYQSQAQLTGDEGPRTE